MMKKNNERLVKHFFNISNALDEYQLSSIHKKISHTSIILFYTICFLALVQFIIDVYNQSFSPVNVILIIILIIYSLYLLNYAQKNNLVKTDIYSKNNLKKYKKFVLYDSIRVCLLMSVGMFLWMEYIVPFIFRDELKFQLIDLILWGGSGVVLGLFNYFNKLSKVTNHSDYKQG